MTIRRTDRELAKKLVQGQRSVPIAGTRGGLQRLNWRELEYLRELAARMKAEERPRRCDLETVRPGA